VSRIKCDQVGKVDIRRFRPKGKIGEVRQETLHKVELILRRLLEFVTPSDAQRNIRTSA